MGWLALTRAINEEIVIDGRIRIRVLGFRGWSGNGPRVQIGIDAPREMRVDRAEVAEARTKQEREGANGDQAT